MNVLIEPLSSEKVIKMLELENKMVFRVDRRARKTDIKKEFEETFKVKVVKINMQIRNNKKIAYIKLDKKNPAINIATKLGMI
ncbi:MAG: 50S ribosomal protein L23 [archaeon]